MDLSGAGQGAASRGEVPANGRLANGSASDGPVGPRGRRERAEEVSSEELLARYRRRRSARLREQLVERHRSDVEAIARSLATRLPSRVDVDDLVHAGLWGLLQAIEKFRAERGAPFKPFMRPRVRGAMLDELRNLDFLPRLYRRRQRERDATVLRMRERLGRDPSDGEMAEELGIDENRFRRLYNRMSFGTLAPNHTAETDRSRAMDGEWVESLAADDSRGPFAQAERVDLLRAIESSLQPVEWTVLRLHYLEGMSGREIAESLHLSAARICQIHVRVLARLKARLGTAQGSLS